MADSACLPRILYVDDDQNLLQAVRRQQRKHFDLTISSDPRQALELARTEGPFAVVVSDLRMPGIDGIELLRRIEEVNPDTTRIMLTGNADLESAQRAVNQGHIFRFLTKPCPPEDLRDAIQGGAKLYRLILAERDLLEQTLRGAVEVLTETLSLVDPAAFGVASRLRRRMKQLLGQLRLEDTWQFEVAAMLSQVGCVALPTDLVERLHAGQPLNAEEQETVASHPKVAQQLLRGIPRLEGISEMIGLQQLRFDGEASPPDAPVGEDIPLGSRMLRLVSDLDVLVSAGAEESEALETLATRNGTYDPQLLRALEIACSLEDEHVLREVLPDSLCQGMRLAEDMRAESGLLLMTAGQEVTGLLVQRIHNWIRTSAHVLPRTVRVTVRSAENADPQTEKVDGS